MNITIRSVTDLGLAIRAVRHSSGVRLDDLAASARLSKQFVSDVEHGKSTVQMGLVLKLLAEIGLSLVADIPQEADRDLSVLRAKSGGAEPPG
jgi:transcriptional regulator with XRE-family HTH domain